MSVHFDALFFERGLCAPTAYGELVISLDGDALTVDYYCLHLIDGSIVGDPKAQILRPRALRHNS
jgi:hypothetical protein